MKADIVIGLGFGDEGKGITTDYLCSRNPDALVVRFSGGPQAGHTVMIDDKKHIHSNFGSGTLRGHASYFTDHCCIYPATIYREHEVLVSKGVNPVLTIHPDAKLITPADVAFNRIKSKEGETVGLGIGLTMHRNLNTGYKLTVDDWRYEKVLNAKMFEIHKYYLQMLSTQERVQFNNIVSEEMEDFRKGGLFAIGDEYTIPSNQHLIFEGSQGILLDMDHGVFPNVTYANTTCKNAMSFLNRFSGIHDNSFYYVTRCYQTRHGQGWMSSNKNISLINNSEEINTHNQWQGDFRVGELDYELLNYAIECDFKYRPSWQPTNIVVTCLDQRPDFVFEPEKFIYPTNVISSNSPFSKNFIPHGK